MVETSRAADRLRVGIAGVGTVGASVVRLLAQQDDALTARTGRKIAVTGFSARDPKKERGFNTSELAFFDDAVALAASPDIDLFVELIGGDEGPARVAV
ncbi:MAG: homoserine dehydrogenase, partial [Rhodoblastus sp.]